MNTILSAPAASRPAMLRAGLLSVCVLGLLAAGTAQAEWKVADGKARQHLNDLNKKLEIDTGDRKSGDPVEDAKQKIEAHGITLDTNIGRCAGARAEQKAVCEEIVRTENAQYLYMVAMHDITKKRQDRLKALEDENFGTNDFGEMQANTNRITALQTRIAIDRAQMESANLAYENRLRYLRAQQVQSTEETMTGKKKNASGGFWDQIASLGPSLYAGVAMKVALNSVKSSVPNDGRFTQYKRIRWNNEDHGSGSGN